MPRSELSKSGWKCVGVLDALAPRNWPQDKQKPRCAFCNKELRWVHVLERVKGLGGSVFAGCECAANVCDGYDAEAGEKFAQKLRRWMRPDRWKPSRTNRDNLVRDVVEDGKKRWRVTVFRKDFGWKVVINKVRGDEVYFDRKVWSTRAGAQEESLRFLERVREGRVRPAKQRA